MWTDIFTGLALLLVFEGLLPFLSPRGYKAAVAELLRFDDTRLRLIALSSMIVGVVLLMLLR